MEFCCIMRLHYISSFEYYGTTSTYLIVVSPVLRARGTVTSTNPRLGSRTSIINTEVIPTNLASFGVTPELISTATVASLKVQWHAARRGVQT